MIRRIVALTIAVIAVTTAATAGRADAVPVSGVRSSGTLVVSANVSGQTINVGGNVALYRRGALYRLDVLSLGFPGTDSFTSALAGSLLGQGGATLIYDGSNGTLIAYSNANRTYYTQPGRPPASTSGAPASDTTNDPLGALASLTRGLRDVQSAAIQLLGHPTVNGHPVTDLDVQMKRQPPNKALENYHARIELADDLNGFPVQIALSSVPATPNAFGGTFKLDLTSVENTIPDVSLFAIPDGYTRVSSLEGVLGHSLH